MDLVTEDPEKEAVSAGDPIEELMASGALDAIFAKIDAGEIEMTGQGGLIPGLIKAALERGLQAELSEHLGYEKGAVEASLFANSRNGSTPKTLASQVGQIPLEVPRDREGSFTPRLVPKGSRRLGGLDEMIICLCGRDDDPRHPAPPGLHDRHRALPRDDQQDHRGGPRGGPGLAAAPVGGLLPGDLSRRAGGQGPRWRTRAQQGRPHRCRGRHGRHQARPGDRVRPTRAPSSGPGSAPSWPTAASARC